MRKMFEKEIGITLIALIITIIILLILSGITILQLSQKGILDNAKLAEQNFKESQEQEYTTLTNNENKIGEYIDGNRETVTIDREEYEELLNKTNNIGQIYSKTNTITISKKQVWTAAGGEATYTIPAGTWVIDFNFFDSEGGSGIWTFFLGGLGIKDTIWKTGTDYSNTHFTWVKTYAKETTSTFSYYQTISTKTRDIDFTMYAVRIK